MASLADRVQSLPAELVDKIIDLVFTPDLTSTITLTKDHKPPHLLHVNRSTRASFAEAYYSNTPVEMPKEEYRLRLGSFLRSLPPAHRLFINKIHIMRDLDEHRLLWSSLRAGDLLEKQVKVFLQFFGTSIDKEQILQAHTEVRISVFNGANIITASKGRPGKCGTFWYFQ